MSRPSGPHTATVRELTLRGIILGGIITLFFTAANVYLGLKVGLTFATSIPAAVISMAVLRWFKDHSVVENNIVQTIASAAGTLSAIIFVLPGLVIVGWWTGFPYWSTMTLCAIGGTLGVMYSIPLRRALVTDSDLPYPEGVAGAEVLKVGDSQGGEEENKRGLRVIIVGALTSVGFSILTALKAAAGSLSATLRIGSGGTMFATGLSFALIGVGHLVGLTVGIAMLIGMAISYGGLLPYFSSGRLPEGDASEAISTIFAQDVRFVGAGTIAIAAVWTFIKVIGPIIKGIRDAAASTAKRRAGTAVPVTERDLPLSIVIGVILASMLPIAFILWHFLQGAPIAHNTFILITVSVLFVLLIGLAVASVCGYMAGLIGASNSPISGVGIIVVIAAALIIKAVHGGDASETTALVAYTIFTAAVVFGVATISNDNLQDLKTGQLVGSTPWKQQVALVIGVVFGSLVIPPILTLMSSAFGFVGAPGAGPNALPAPQASLISSLAQGVLGADINWGLIGLGALIGAVVIAIDETLNRTTRFALPPLAVGMGMYLPMTATLLIPIGAALGVAYNRFTTRLRDPEKAQRLGVLLATGLIVGESLFGVAFAGTVVLAGNEEPLAIVGDSFATPAMVIGIAVFAGMIAVLYRWLKGQAR
ncbi:MAG: oligopeptide transporter, OPT family [Bowdeniella nasicola]|nr:oligopeptide transporter, OPT family [Bowdeniella nasicola]